MGKLEVVLCMRNWECGGEISYIHVVVDLETGAGLHKDDRHLEPNATKYCSTINKS